jgi:hypothetical protein
MAAGADGRPARGDGLRDWGMWLLDWTLAIVTGFLPALACVVGAIWLIVTWLF